MGGARQSNCLLLHRFPKHGDLPLGSFQYDLNFFYRSIDEVQRGLNLIPFFLLIRNSFKRQGAAQVTMQIKS